MISINFKLINKDIRQIDGDIIALKYTKDNYGLSKEILENVQGVNVDKILLFDTLIHQSPTFSKVSNLIFVHLPLNSIINYDDVCNFMKISLSDIKGKGIHAERLITTIQGADFLDEKYSLQSQIEGILESIKSNNLPFNLKQIIIAENDIDRFNRLRQYVDEIFSSCNGFVRRLSYNNYEISCSLPFNFKFPKRKAKHIFVAMPFSDEFEDTFYYGIQKAIERNGYLSLRIDKHKFMGDIVKEMLDKIHTADAIIADLTASNPNVYLELGFAWGQGIKSFLITKDINDLRFDVQGQRCLQYTSIRQLENILFDEIQTLMR